jgi:two-component sensor histidine kinase
MAKRICNFLFSVLAMTFISALGQDTLRPDQDVLQEFQDTDTADDKLHFFFNSVNRYEENSAYDWLDIVNVYLSNARNSGESAAIRNYQLMQAQIYYDLGDFDKSLAIANELYASLEELPPDTSRKLLDLIDDTYAQLQLFDKQIEVRKQKRELGLIDNIAFYDIYANLGMYRKAMSDYIMEVKKTIPEDDFYEQAIYNNKVGDYLRMDKSASTAITHLSRAKGFIDVYLNDLSTVKSEQEIVEGKLLKGIIEGNIGKCYVQLNQYQEAIPYLENSIASIRENNIGTNSEEIIENTLALAECHLQLGHHQVAKNLLDQELKLSDTEYIIRRNRLLAYYYGEIADYENESYYLKRNMRLQDSINANESSFKKQQLLAVVAQEDLANSRRMIDEQKLEMERARNEMQAKDERINLVFISLIFTLLGFAGLVYAYLKSIKNQRLIAEQKYIIETSLVEKDSLLKEIHHRVKNNLQMVSSLLSLQTKNTRSKAVIEALEEGKSRVKAMALIHQKLYQNDDLSVIEMQGYIESLVNSVQSVFKKGGHNINITIDAEGVELDIDRAIPFGLVLNELVSNSFKYAFPEERENNKIYIHLRKNGGSGFFEYTDNGIGLPEDSDERVNSSMGIRLMNRLVNQLQSSLNIDKTSEGVRFWFNFN